MTTKKYYLFRRSRWQLRFLSTLAHRAGNTALGKRLADIYSAR